MSLKLLHLKGEGLIGKMTESVRYFAEQISQEMRQKIENNPDKVYFPNFGSSDNIFRRGITVDRVMFKVPGTNFEIYWYGFLIAVGILLAMMYGFRRMKSHGIDPDRATDAVIAGFVGAIIGARAYYIVFNDEITFKNFFDYRSGGLAIYGGLIGAVLLGGLVVKLRKVKLTAMLDVAAPCFLIGQCIGRWGNFVNQEAFGANTDLPWGMISASTMKYIAVYYDELGGQVSSYAPVHPCFLYESLWCALCFVILHFYDKHRKFDGEVFLMYIGLYGLGRFFIEATRTDSLYLANIKVSQLVAGTCVFTSLVLIVIFRSMVRRGDYKFFYQTELSKRQLAAVEEYEKNERERRELKKKIAECRKKGESFAEYEKEFESRFGKEARKEAARKANELDKEKKSLKAAIKQAKKSGETARLSELQKEYADKFGGSMGGVTVEDTEDSGEKYTSILADDDGEEDGE